MNKELRRVSVVVLAMFIALFFSTSIIQVVEQRELKANQFNVRTLYASFSAQRGPILVDGTPVAESVPVDDPFSYQRRYPDGPLYSAATGYFTLNQGTTGIEAALNDYMSGTSDEQFLNRLNAVITGRDPQGAAVELTLDPEVQEAAYQAMGELSGGLVALDPTTGEILALVSTPAFDPNELAGHDTNAVIDRYNELIEDPDQPLDNRAIAGELYHPGSTFKLVVASAALENGYAADDRLPNPASLQLPATSTVIGNSGGGSCGGGGDEVTIADAIRFSCNIPFAELGLEVGYDAIAAQAAAYGFGDESLEIPVPVTASVYPPVESDAQLMLSAFGQANVRVTPLQMAMVSAAIANDGALMRPALVESIVAPDLSVLEEFQPSEYGRPISAETANAITGMMVSSVASGAATNARIGGIDVAGKTGTAQNGENEPYTLWFTGFAPAEDPRVAVAVVIEDGGGLGQSGFGNTVAAPIAKKVIEAVLSE